MILMLILMMGSENITSTCFALWLCWGRDSRGVFDKTDFLDQCKFYCKVLLLICRLVFG